jgi:hypothetical protein
MRLEGLGKSKKSTSSGTRTGDLPACSIVPQPSTLPRAPDRLLVTIANLKPFVYYNKLWTTWHWGSFSPSTSASPANSHSTNCSKFIIIYHPGLVQSAKQWPTYQVDSVSPHPKTKTTVKLFYASKISFSDTTKVFLLSHYCFSYAVLTCTHYYVL